MTRKVFLWDVKIAKFSNPKNSRIRKFGNFDKKLSDQWYFNKNAVLYFRVFVNESQIS